MEYDLTKELRHPNICSVQSWFGNLQCGLCIAELCCSFRASSGQLLLVQEYACKGDLFEPIDKGGGLGNDTVKRYFTQIVRSISNTVVIIAHRFTAA